MKRWVNILQDFTFVQLFYLWVSIGLGFAIIYYILSFLPQSSLLYLNEPINHNFSDFLTMIYFSFITLTSTGYGDVVPQGISKILSIFEIFSGLVVFGFLISKLITARQRSIIEELYDLSFEETISRMRSSLYVYRANISRIIDRVSLTRRVKYSDITDLEANLEGLKSNINRVRRFLISESKKPITKLDELTLNLLFNSLSLSISRMIEVLELLKSKKCEWKKNTTIKYVSDCIASIKELQELYEKKPLKEELKNLLKTFDDSLKKLEDLIK